MHHNSDPNYTVRVGEKNSSRITLLHNHNYTHSHPGTYWAASLLWLKIEMPCSREDISIFREERVPCSSSPTWIFSTNLATWSKHFTVITDAHCWFVCQQHTAIFSWWKWWKMQHVSSENLNTHDFSALQRLAQASGGGAVQQLNLCCISENHRACWDSKLPHTSPRPIQREFSGSVCLQTTLPVINCDFMDEFEVRYSLWRR